MAVAEVENESVKVLRRALGCTAFELRDALLTDGLLGCDQFVHPFHAKRVQEIKLGEELYPQVLYIGRGLSHPVPETLATGSGDAIDLAGGAVILRAEGGFNVVGFFKPF